jgi:hypothetical protein
VYTRHDSYVRDMTGAKEGVPQGDNKAHHTGACIRDMTHVYET